MLRRGIMKKQITIDGGQSDWFEKAVFTLKENKSVPMSKNLFQYAEQLVETQLKKAPLFTREPVKKVETGYDPYIENLKVEVARKQEILVKKQKRAKLIDTFLYFSISFCFICVICLLVKIYS